MRRRWLVVAEHKSLFDFLVPPHSARRTFTYHRFRWQAWCEVIAWHRAAALTLTLTSARIVGRVTEKAA